MRFIDFIKVALQNLWRRKVRTFLTIVAVFVGTLAVVALISLGMGAQNVFVGQLEKSGMMNQITVTPSIDASASLFGGSEEITDDENSVKLDQTIIDQVTQVNNVIAVSAVKYAHPFESVQLKGTEKKYRTNISSASANQAGAQTLQAGRNFDSDDELNKVIIGNSFLKTFEFATADDALGQILVFETYPGYHNVDTPLPDWRNSTKEDWEVSAVFEAEIIGVGIPGPTEQNMIITNGWARRLLTERRYGETTQEEKDRVEQLNRELGESDRQIVDDEWYQPQPTIEEIDQIAENGYDNLVALANNAENVDQIAADIETLGVGAFTVAEFLDDILRIFLIVQIVLGAIGGIALLVASIGIINTMIMAVMERTREIGVMKAVGASRGTIRTLFTFEAAFIGFWGGVLGVAAGYGLGQLVNFIAQRYLSDQSFALESIIIFPWYLIIGTIAFSTFVGLIAGLYPAAKAARLDAVEALRRE
ncbi:MAG: ABC transporter permease [Patescibacteria group bacterium]